MLVVSSRLPYKFPIPLAAEDLTKMDEFTIFLHSVIAKPEKAGSSIRISIFLRSKSG